MTEKKFKKVLIRNLYYHKNIGWSWIDPNEPEGTFYSTNPCGTGIYFYNAEGIKTEIVPPYDFYISIRLDFKTAYNRIYWKLNQGIRPEALLC